MIEEEEKREEYSWKVVGKVMEFLVEDIEQDAQPSVKGLEDMKKMPSRG